MRLRFAVQCALGLLLAACARPSTPASSVPGTSDQPPTWSQILDGAKREGTVAVWGQTGTTTSDALVAAFQQAHPDIMVDYTAVTGAQMVTKLLTERAAGLYSVDVVVHGTTSVVEGLLPEGVADPLPPALVGPDNDPEKWRGGAYNFADEAGLYNLILLGGQKVPLIFNPNLVNPAELTSFNDLLDPKWRGKIVMLDPRTAGAGLGSATFFYVTPELGKEYIQKLFLSQRVVFTKDDRQLTDWIARGQYLIGLASNDFTAMDLRQRGVPIESLPGDALKEGTYLTAAWGSVVLGQSPAPPQRGQGLPELAGLQGGPAGSCPGRRVPQPPAGCGYGCHQGIRHSQARRRVSGSAPRALRPHAGRGHRIRQDPGS